MLRWMCRKTRHERVRVETRLKWFEHVVRRVVRSLEAEVDLKNL